jgi:hypothetical protein
MNNILNKIAQMERNAAELQGVELAKHEVELAIPDKLIATLKKTNQLKTKFDQVSLLYVKYVTEAPRLLKEIQADLTIIEQEEARISKLVKDLGMNPNEMPYLKQAAEAFSLLSKLEDRLKTNLK